MTETIEQVQSGSEVTMHVKIMLKDKTIAQDSRQEDQPVTVQIGEGHFTDNFERHLLGLKAGEKNVFMVPTEDSFGERDLANIHLVPRSQFPKSEPLEPGIIFMFTQPNGAELPGVILEALEDQVKIDFNHPLSGQELIFEVEILGIETPLKHE